MIEVEKPEDETRSKHRAMPIAVLRTSQVLAVLSFLIAVIQLLSEDPFGKLFDLLLWGPLWGLLLLAWLGWLVFSHIFYRERKFTRSDETSLVCWGLATPLLCMLTCWLVITDTPFRLKFWASRSAFEKLANQASSAPLTTGPCRVGWFALDGIDAGPALGSFFWSGSGGRACFRYDKTGGPAEWNSIDLGDGWYAVKIPDS